MFRATIRLRQDIKEEWERINPALLKGEMGLVSDGNETKAKKGDGIHLYAELSFIEDWGELKEFTLYSYRLTCPEGCLGPIMALLSSRK